MRLEGRVLGRKGATFRVGSGVRAMSSVRLGREMLVSRCVLRVRVLLCIGR